MANFERSLSTYQSDSDSELSATCASTQRCSRCATEEGCGWCGDAADGSCQLKGDFCSYQLVEARDHCPAAGANVVLRNVSGFLGAMLAVAVLLNVLNRCQNRRRNNKLKKSIFTLPCYVYPSREKRAAALREARSRFGGPLHPAPDVEQISDGECSDQGAAAMPSCTICLSTYENDEVIKVLPCGHDFHSECLNSWLEMKAMCPLCKTPAFSNGRDAHPRKGRGRAQIESSDPAGRSNRERWRVLRARPWLGQRTTSAPQDPARRMEEARGIGVLATCPCGSPRDEVCEEGRGEAIEVKEEVSRIQGTSARETSHGGASDVAVKFENGHGAPRPDHEVDAAPDLEESLPAATHSEDIEAGDALPQSLPLASAKEPQGVASAKGIRGGTTDAEFVGQALRAQFSMSQSYPTSKPWTSDRAVET